MDRRLSVDGTSFVVTSGGTNDASRKRNSIEDRVSLMFPFYLSVIGVSLASCPSSLWLCSRHACPHPRKGDSERKERIRKGERVIERKMTNGDEKISSDGSPTAAVESLADERTNGLQLFLL